MLLQPGDIPYRSVIVEHETALENCTLFLNYLEDIVHAELYLASVFEPEEGKDVSLETLLRKHFKFWTLQGFCVEEFNEEDEQHLKLFVVDCIAYLHYINREQLLTLQRKIKEMQQSLEYELYT